MAELLAATAGLFGGIGVGFAGNRRPGAWFPIVVTVVAAACVATVVYASRRRARVLRARSASRRRG